MKTGIVILNYNDAENTSKMIEQIKDFECLSKIVIVDNCSTDDSVSILKKYESKKIKLLESSHNKGYGSGNNMGLKYLEEHTECELVIISNPDIVVEESVIKEMIKDMKTDPSLSFLGPKIIENGTISKGWKLPTYFREVLSTINFFHRFAEKLQRYKKEYYCKRLTDVEVIHGSFFMARMKDFKRIHYFDPHTFLYYEENIIGKKAQSHNLKITVDLALSVEHQCSLSVDKSLNKIKKYKALKKSMFYYETTYEKIGFLKLWLLKLVYYCSLGILYLTFWI